MSFPSPMLFLPCAGKPAIEWKVWQVMFFINMIMLDSDKFSTEKQGAIIQTCLRAEGQRIL